MKRTYAFLIMCLSTLMLTTTLNAQQTDDSKKTWANYERYAADNEALEVAPVAVFMGNSITDNWARMHGEFFKQYNYVGRGISGQVTAQMLARFQADVIDLHPQVVAILAGTNDIAQNMQYIELQNIAQNIYSMCEIAKAHRIKVILCSVLPANRYGWRPAVGDPSQQIIQLNAMIQAYALKNKIPYVDYHTAMKDQTNGLPEKISPDGVHPNLDGYAIMEPMIVGAIRQLTK